LSPPTGPLQYLVLIGAIDVVPRLFEAVTIPAVVQAELLHPVAPAVVRAWAGTPPRANCFNGGRQRLRIRTSHAGRR
jgi:hypothetical protein